MNSKISNTLLSITSVALFAACSDSSSNNYIPQSEPQNISGLVSDPAIKQALVKICEKENLSSCLDYIDRTDEEGIFEISNIPATIDLNDYILVTEGGIDTQTQESFDNLSLTMPLNALDNNYTSAVVSPLTTLMQTNDWSVSEAASMLGIDEDDLLLNPSSKTSLQKKALIITQIAKKMDDGFDSIDSNLSDLEEYVSTNIIDERKRKEMLTLVDVIEDLNNTNSVVSNFNSLKTIFGSSLYTDNNSTENKIYENIKTINTKILKHLADENISQSNLEQIQAVFINSDIGTDNLLDDINITIDTSNINLKDIIPLNTLYNHTQELSSALGDDSDARREYYYNSTASKLYEAEQLIKGMNDVSVSDDAYVDIAKEYISNNETERALEYAKNKIFLKENKADVMRLIGEKLIDTNTTKAKELFDEAFVLYKEVTEAKGEGNLKNSDIFDYRYLLKDYTALGETVSANNVTSYITEKVEEYKNTSQITSYVVGIYQAADELLEKNEIEEAVAILDSAAEIIDSIPANYADTKALSGQYYKSKVWAGLQIAYRYALAGPAYFDKAEDLADKMQAIRLDDGNTENGIFPASGDTGAKTKAYVATSSGFGANLVSIYVKIGELQKALAVIPTATSSSYEQNGYMVYALGLAMTEDDLDGAFEVIDNNITDYDDKLKALTYNGINKGGAFIAQQMIDDKQSAKAKLAIDKAVEILDAAVADGEESSDSKKDMHYVRYGYAKLANLYGMIGEETLATTYFDKAVAIATGTESNASIAISDEGEQLDSIFEIVDNLDEIDRTDDVTTLMNTAISKVAALGSTKEKLSEYSELLFYHASQSDSYTLERTYEFQKTVADAMKALILDNDGSIGESSDDNDYKKAVSYLIEMAATYYELTEIQESKSMLSSATTYAQRIASESTKVSYLQKIVDAYAIHGFISEASDVADLIEYGSDKREAIASIAEQIYLGDAFKDCSVASIDTDGDSKPDFYNYGASQAEIDACSLILDDDIDGDGVLDTTDLRPYFQD